MELTVVIVNFNSDKNKLNKAPKSNDKKEALKEKMDLLVDTLSKPSRFLIPDKKRKQ